jgi:hypothetical protein
MNNAKQEVTLPIATPEDLQRLLGDLDGATISAIMTLAPSMAEIEKAALWVVGEGETMPARQQPQGKIKAILDLIVVVEEEEQRER